MVPLFRVLCCVIKMKTRYLLVRIVKKYKNKRVRELMTRKVKEESNCPSCLENIIEGEEVYDIKCKHVFHMKCTEDWFESNIHNDNTCPLCREQLVGSNIEMVEPGAISRRLGDVLVMRKIKKHRTS